MEFTVRPFRQADAEQIAQWHYEGPYAFSSFRLSVAAFNQRAIRLYAKAGFKPTRSSKHHTNGGVFDFLEMAREA